MRVSCRPLFTAATLLVALFLAPSAQAVFANRVFVSQRSGNDANACDNILTPCQSFAGAVLQLNPGGEAIVLDSGGYGPVTITQAVTIEAAPGVTAFIHPPSGYAITVNAGSSDAVILRGLVLNGGSTNGIVVNTVGVLHIENCVISGFAGAGILVNVASQVFIKDTISRQNQVGVWILGGRASVDHCRFEANEGDGLFVDGADVTVRDSVAAGNATYGFSVFVFGTEGSVLNLHQCISTNNGSDGFRALSVGSGGFIHARVANSSISENVGYGLHNLGGIGVTFESLGNNFVRGNVAGDVMGTIMVVSGQ